MFRFTAPQSAIAEMVHITGDPIEDVTAAMTVNLWWAVCNVQLADWARAVEYAAYDRKCSVLGLLRWPLHQLMFDVCYTACGL